MALLDMSDVLTDPDLCDASLICERNAQSVSGGGMGSIKPLLIPFAGVVTSGDGDVLERAGEGDRIRGNISIVTTFALRNAGPNFSADIVQWRGKRYTVSSVNDYMHFGSGFVEALCDILPVSG